MINYKFTLTNKAGSSIDINDFTTDPDNFIALQDYPVSDVAIKNSETDREGQHGIWDFFSFYGKRSMTFSGVIVGVDEAHVETQKVALLKVLSLPPIPNTSNDGYINVKWTDANNDDWQIDAKLQSYPKFSRDMRKLYRLDFQFTLKSKNPEIESQDEIINSGVRAWEQGMLTLPTELPNSFSVDFNNKITVNNQGSLQSHTVIRIYGEDNLAITNPYIYNITTGKIFKLNITLNGSNEYVEIDSKNGTVIDQDGNDQSANVDGTSEYIILNVGENIIVFLSDESSGDNGPVKTWIYPEAEITISHRTTVI